MRIVVLLVVAAGLAVPGAALGAPPKVTLAFANTRPKVNEKVPWSVTAKVAGKPAAGTVSAFVVDPLGTAHRVQFWASKKYVSLIAFRGRFADAVSFPAAAKGFPLKFVVVVRIGGKPTKVSTTVTVR